MRKSFLRNYTGPIHSLDGERVVRHAKNETFHLGVGRVPIRKWVRVGDGEIVTADSIRRCEDCSVTLHRQVRDIIRGIVGCVILTLAVIAIVAASVLFIREAVRDENLQEALMVMGGMAVVSAVIIWAIHAVDEYVIKA